MTDQENPTGEDAEYDQTEQRLAAVESGLAEQKGLLAQILDRLPGGGGATGGDTAPAPSGDAGETPPAGPSIKEQIRQGVAEIQAEQQAAADEEGWRTKVDQHLAEHAPSVPTTGKKTRLQKILFGGD